MSGGKVAVIGAVAVMALATMVMVPIGIMTMMVGMMGAEIAQQQAADDCAPMSDGQVYASSGPVRMPLTGKFKVTSPYGMRTQPVMGVYRLHAGVDLAMIPTGGPVLAAKAGTVRSTTPNAPGAGNNIEIDHGGGLSTRYLHLASFSVEPGQKVKAGQKIGTEGNTTGPGASISTGPHLHFEVHKNGNPTDPRDWLKNNGITLPKVGGIGTVKDKPARKSAKDSRSTAVQATAKESGGAASGFKMPKPEGPGKHTPGPNPPMPPPAHLKAMKAAEAKYGIPWEWLAAHSYEETHHWQIKEVSWAGAMGPMQFTPPTWSDFGVDGNGDGKADILNVQDAIFSAANMLSKTGGKDGPEGVKRAIMRYNQAQWYVSDILWLSQKYGNGQVSVSGSTAVSGGCAADVANASTATKQCKKTASPAEEGLQPNALNGLRCGKAHAPWVETMYGVGERAIADDHPKGRAVDFMIPEYASSAGHKRGQKLARWFEDHADDLGVQYVIYNQRIWNIDKAGQGWRPMEDRGSPTANHKDHVHVSFTSETTSG